MSKKTRRAITVFTLLALGVMPIGVYMLTFGTHISQSHSRWAEAGSAMTGIYSPILSAITILLLYHQYKLQRAQHNVQLKLAELAAIQEIVSSRNELLTGYLTQLNLSFPGQKLSDKLYGNQLSVFYGKTKSELDEIKSQARSHYFENPSILDQWMGVYSSLAGLAEEPHPSVQSLRISMMLRVNATLSMPVVQALDNYLYCLGMDLNFYISGGPKE